MPNRPPGWGLAGSRTADVDVVVTLKADPGGGIKAARPKTAPGG